MFFDNSFSIAAILENGNFVTRKSTSVLLQENEIRPSFYIIDENGTILRSFGNARFYDDQLMKSRGNSASYVIDSNKNIFQVYNSQNKIVKFSLNGKPLITFNRFRPFEESLIAEKKSVKYGGSPGTMIIWNQFYGYNSVIDHKNRLWVLSRNIEHDGSFDFNSKPGLYNLDVYSPEGILLESFPWDSAAYRYPLNSFEDKIYFTNSKDMTIHEYKIIEH